jgi:predicted AlkP superfamily phosphohydrolase/phosphomutase
VLLIVGLDGATFDLLTPWLAEGHLPTMARLQQQGVSGSLASTTPPLTPAAWATFMSGKNPGKHGIFDFFHPRSPDLDRPELVNMTDIKARPFWDYLCDAGQRVGLLNLPLTYPPPPVNGFLVPGLLSPDEGTTTFPPDLLTPYRAKLGPYRLVPHLPYQPHRIDDFVAELRHVTETQIQYALHLAQDHPLDFLMVHFFAPDLAQHKLWHTQDKSHPWYRPELRARYGTAIRDLFAQIDEGLAALLTLLPPDTAVILMSDHGFGPQHEVVNLNNYLRQTGLLALKPFANVRRRAWLARQKGLDKVAIRLARYWGRKRLLGFADVDWQRTRAYARGHMGQLYLNLQGREPQGIVHPDDYHAVRNEVSALLQSLRHPEGKQPLIQNIIPNEAAAHGPYLHHGPDLHLIMDDYRALAYPLFAADDRLVTQQPLVDSGNHRPEGIFVAAGSGLRRGETIQGARLLDLAPTILHWLGVSPPDDMDGRVLTEIFTADFNGRHPLTYQPALAAEPASAPLSTAAQAQLAERLRALGYL